MKTPAKYMTGTTVMPFNPATFGEVCVIGSSLGNNKNHVPFASAIFPPPIIPKNIEGSGGPLLYIHVFVSCQYLLVFTDSFRKYFRYCALEKNADL